LTRQWPKTYDSARFARTVSGAGGALNLSLTLTAADQCLGLPSVFADGNSRIRKAHLIGIAGAGMQALASVLAARGWRVSGSDIVPAGTANLTAQGVRIHTGHAAAHLPCDMDLVIYSDAVETNCPERLHAVELGIETLSYPQMLGRLMTGSTGLAVSGTHGKSTTTAMASTILQTAGLDPTVIAGGIPLDRNNSGSAGQRDLVLVEACEYRANFLHLRPRGAVVLGIEPDHFDYYSSPEKLENAFRQFVELVPDDGFVIARSSCQTTRRVTANLACRLETFGLADEDYGKSADWQANSLRHEQGRYRFEIMHQGNPIGSVALRVPGRHNVLNALAAGALAWHAGARSEEICRGLDVFLGLKRRLETVISGGEIVLLDDYAHHPTEIRATLATVRLMYPGRRIWCIFQPHQVSRTRHLLDEFAQSLHNADAVLVADIYRAREGGAVPGEVTAADLADRVNAVGGRAAVGLHGMDAILEHLLVAVAPGDVVITLGAGDIRKVCDGFADRLRADCAAC
jgi:UDP-N-acetylmuramate--alanine ligase